MCLQAQKKKFYSFSYFKYAFIIFELLIFIKEVNIVLSHIFILYSSSFDFIYSFKSIFLSAKNT